MKSVEKADANAKAIAKQLLESSSSLRDIWREIEKSEDLIMGNDEDFPLMEFRVILSSGNILLLMDARKRFDPKGNRELSLDDVIGHIISEWADK